MHFRFLYANCSFFIHKAQNGGLHTKDFDLSHMPNLLDTHRNKLKAVCMFDSMCTDVLRSLPE